MWPNVDSSASRSVATTPSTAFPVITTIIRGGAGLIVDDGDHEEEAGVQSELEQRRVDLHSQLDDPFADFRPSIVGRLARLQPRGDRGRVRSAPASTNRGPRPGWILSTSAARLRGHHGPAVCQSGLCRRRGGGLCRAHRHHQGRRLHLRAEPSDDPVGSSWVCAYDRQDTTLVDPGCPTATSGPGPDRWGWFGISRSWSLAGASTGPSARRPPKSSTPTARTRPPLPMRSAIPTSTPEWAHGLEAVAARGLRPLRGDPVSLCHPLRRIHLPGRDRRGDRRSRGLQFSQDDAEFKGFELHGHFEILHAGSKPPAPGLLLRSGGGRASATPVRRCRGFRRDADGWR